MNNALIQYGRLSTYKGADNYRAIEEEDNYPVALVKLEETAFPEVYKNSIVPAVSSEPDLFSVKVNKADFPLMLDYGEGLRYANLQSLKYSPRYNKI